MTKWSFTFDTKIVLKHWMERIERHAYDGIFSHHFDRGKVVRPSPLYGLNNNLFSYERLLRIIKEVFVCPHCSARKSITLLWFIRSFNVGQSIYYTEYKLDTHTGEKNVWV
jgi:hypothetical protein